MRKILTSIMLAVSMAVFSACAQGENAGMTAADEKNTEVTDAGDILKDSQGNVTFRDSTGRSITVNSPERVVTLLGSFCDEWLLAGGSVVGTADDSFKSFDLKLSDDVVNIGSHIKPDIEKIVGLKPDFVIASAALDSQSQLLDTLNTAGITVAFFEVNNINDYLKTLKIFTEITGREDLYEKNGALVLEQVNEAKKQIDGRKPKVLFIRAAASGVKVKGSSGTVGGEILKDLDTINIADSESLLEELSMEAIILADPDYIFVTTQGNDTQAALDNVDKLMISNPAWNTLKAVADNNYYVLDKALYNSKPNARWGEAYKRLADIIYPES